MHIDIENIEDLKNNDSALENTPLPEKKVDEHGRAYATGKRKNAVARVWLKPGSGIIKINGKIRQEGKDYVIKDGDILNFKFNL